MAPSLFSPPWRENPQHVKLAGIVLIGVGALQGVLVLLTWRQRRRPGSGRVSSAGWGFTSRSWAGASGSASSERDFSLRWRKSVERGRRFRPRRRKSAESRQVVGWGFRNANQDVYLRGRPVGTPCWRPGLGYELVLALSRRIYKSNRGRGSQWVQLARIAIPLRHSWSAHLPEMRRSAATFEGRHATAQCSAILPSDTR